MSEIANRYAGACNACNKIVKPGEGRLEWVGRPIRRRGNQYKLWCLECFNRSDNSGEEDRCCGDRAYEDACAMACGFQSY
jgi:hypothetical protein